MVTRNCPVMLRPMLKRTALKVAFNVAYGPNPRAGLQKCNKMVAPNARPWAAVCIFGMKRFTHGLGTKTCNLLGGNRATIMTLRKTSNLNKHM